MSRPPTPQDSNAELMRLMGSESGRYDPEPPEQWRWQLAHGSPKERAFAWVKWKTTGHKDFDQRSPFCVSEHGTPLTIKHAAVDLNWEYEYARHVFAELEAEGRVRLEKGKRIWNRADVPVLERTAEEDAAEKDAAETANGSVHNRWDAYITDSIENVPQEKREEFKVLATEFLDWRDRGFSEMVAGWRLMVEQVENIMFARVGGEKKRLPKVEREKQPVVQLTLIDLPEFVQTDSTNSALELVQTAKPNRTRRKRGSHKPPSGGASLLPLDQDQKLKSVSRSVVDPAPVQDGPTDAPAPIPEQGHATAEDVRAVILEQLHNRLPYEMPTPAMCGEIGLILRGVPLERFALALRHRKWKPSDTMGLCKNIAHDVAEAWRTQETARAAEQKTRTVPDGPMSGDERAQAERMRDDPEESERFRTMAREALERDDKKRPKAKGATT